MGPNLFQRHHLRKSTEKRLGARVCNYGCEQRRQRLSEPGRRASGRMEMLS